MTEKQTAETKQKLWQKLFRSRSDVIALCILLAAALAVLLSPNIYLVNTAKWTDWNKKNRSMVEAAMGTEHTEERFRLYFQYYNVIHELGHGLIIYNKGVNIPIAEEEQLVNDFAVAYWRYFGEPERIDALHDIVTYAVSNIGDNEKNGVDYMENAKEHSDHSDFDSDFFNFEDYGWFQFSCVKHSIEHEKPLEDVLHEMGFKDFTLPEKKLLEHKVIDENESTAIINEAVRNFNDWGLKFPEAHQSFRKDPNMNSSRPFKNILGIVKLL